MPTMFAAREMKRLTPAATPRKFRFQASQDFARDLDILRFVDRMGYASSDQIARAVGGSERGVKNRLRLLFDHQLVLRPVLQGVVLHAFHSLGNHPLVYGLAPRGKRLLIEHDQRADDTRDYTRKAARVVPLQLAHTVEVAELVLQFEAACRAHPAGLSFFDQHQLLEHMPEATRASRKPFACSLSVTLPKLRDPLALTIIPDRLIGIGYPDATRTVFACELDRGSESVGGKKSKLVGRSTFRKKLISYWNAWRQDLHTTRWGFTTGFRVATITTTEARLGSMLAAQREIVGGPTALFLYTTTARLAAHGPLGPTWSSSTEDGICLLPASLQPTMEPPRAR